MFVDQLSDLNAQQTAAVRHDGSPLLIVAGAGTGKTKTLVSRVLHLMSQGADPSRILLLTFTRRSAAELIARVVAASGSSQASQIWGGTFHSIANRLLRSYSVEANTPNAFTILDQADSTDIFGLVRNELGLGERGKRFPRKETIAAIYSRMVNRQTKLAEVLREDFPWCADHGDELKAVFGAYTAQKRSHRVLDYDDLLLYWRGLLKADQGAILRNLFDHILIDEYQDTNPIQVDIIEGMCRPDTGLVAVGDDAQSIYGFRAATVANMWEFTTRFPGAERITLDINYRSTQPILDTANQMMEHSDRYGPDGGPAHFTKTLQATRGHGPTPRLAVCRDEAAQSRFVCEQILDARERGIALRDQAVLVRAGHHSDHLELELARRDIPFVKYGGLKYLEAAHIKDLLSLLRVLENPADQLAWNRVLTAIPTIGPATVRSLSDQIGLDDPATAPNALNRLLDEALDLPARSREPMSILSAALRDCRDHPIGPAEQIERLRTVCEMTFPASYPNAAVRLSDLDQLSVTASGYDSRAEFLTELTLDPPERTGDLAGPPHLDDDWMTISTIHSAKGMEWKSVYVIHAADGNVPSDMATGNNDELAEELRLLYVALTRARDELTVSFPLRYHVQRYTGSDRHHLAQLSRFLQPIQDRFEAVTDEHDAATAPVIDTVGVAVEVDVLLHSLWED